MSNFGAGLGWLYLTVVLYFDRCPRAKSFGGSLAILGPCVLVNFSYGVLSDREINFTLFHDTLPCVGPILAAKVVYV